MSTCVNSSGRSAGSRESGAVLFLGLMLLLTLTLLGAAYFQEAIIQERLSGNYMDLNYAFEAAEAGGRWGSAWLQSRSGTPAERPWPCLANCDSGSVVWVVGQFPDDPHPKAAFWATARGYGIDPGTGEDLLMRVPLAYQQPRYILEQQHFQRDDLAGDPQKGVAFYRVTSLGIGQRPSSDAVLRSVIAKRFE